MELIVAEVVAVLSRTPPALNVLLDGLPPSMLQHRLVEGTFSPADVIGHLIQGEKTDWVPRIQQILATGDAKPFARFDREGFRSPLGERQMPELLEEFSTLRLSNLEFLRSLSLTRAQLALPGLHPDLGRVTLEQLLVTWAVHDLNHVDQVARVLSHRYVDAVGPWKTYLGVLNRQGRRRGRTKG
jgi:hypothetical protein